MTKYPQFQTVVDPLHGSANSTAIFGVDMGTQKRDKIVEGAIETALTGQGT